MLILCCYNIDMINPNPNCSKSLSDCMYKYECEGYIVFDRRNFHYSICVAYDTDDWTCEIIDNLDDLIYYLNKGIKFHNVSDYFVLYGLLFIKFRKFKLNKRFLFYKKLLFSDFTGGMYLGDNYTVLYSDNYVYLSKKVLYKDSLSFIYFDDDLGNFTACYNESDDLYSFSTTVLWQSTTEDWYMKKFNISDLIDTTTSDGRYLLKKLVKEKSGYFLRLIMFK